MKPQLVAISEFLEWSDTSHVRHIKFVGMRVGSRVATKTSHDCVDLQPSARCGFS
jgi:hypothetical protein